MGREKPQPFEPASNLTCWVLSSTHIFPPLTLWQPALYLMCCQRLSWESLLKNGRLLATYIVGWKRYHGHINPAIPITTQIDIITWNEQWRRRVGVFVHEVDKVYLQSQNLGESHPVPTQVLPNPFTYASVHLHFYPMCQHTLKLYSVSQGDYQSLNYYR